MLAVVGMGSSPKDRARWHFLTQAPRARPALFASRPQGQDNRSRHALHVSRSHAPRLRLYESADEAIRGVVNAGGAPNANVFVEEAVKLEEDSPEIQGKPPSNE